MPAWLLNIVSHWSFKAISIVLTIALLAGGILFAYKTVYNSAYNKGYHQALIDHPQNIFNAPATINQQPCSEPNVYGLQIGKWGLGLIHKR